MENDLTQQLTATLRQTFGFADFRTGQLEALITLMTQKRLLCIQPTGHGKSLLYQLPAVLLDGITLVISPLLALMRDQLKQLTDRFGIAAASINTDQSEEENAAARNAASAGKLRLLFIAPEQLDHIDRLNFLLQLPICLLVVDEAHCISTWGHDFRPSYRQIMTMIHALVTKNTDVKLLGLTATANKNTENDIKQQFDVGNQTLVVHRESMDRPNIRLSVLHTHGAAAKLAALIHLLQQLKGSGLIYCATRENTELVAEYLMGQGFSAVAYHAGFATHYKRQIQQSFIADAIPIIVATNALGMGIDKANLRFIIHFDFPGSISAYYQEVGRCGRDGLPAEGILLYDSADSKIQYHFIQSAQPEATDFTMVLRAVEQSINQAKIPPNLAVLKRVTGMHPTKLAVIVAELVEQGFLFKVSQRGIQSYQLATQTHFPDLSRYRIQKEVKYAELIAMKRYAEQAKSCLMATLRRALGENQAADCKRCSHCDTFPFAVPHDKSLILATTAWIDRRSVPIRLSRKIKNTATGIAVMDGKLRSTDFIHFMRQRANPTTTHAGLSASLLLVIKACLLELAKHYTFGCIVPVPSRTWQGRIEVCQILGKCLNIPVFPDLLSWQILPAARQGELLNNDQRQHNVANSLVTRMLKKLPKGDLLLLDDYTGSGATLNEAARALRDQPQIQQCIVPFTVAAVKWRLGKEGMI